jgi:hypothetical protein
MSEKSSPAFATGNDYPQDSEKVMGEEPKEVREGSLYEKGLDVLGLQDVDPALNAKMHIVNNVSRISAALDTPDHLSTISNF